MRAFYASMAPEPTVTPTPGGIPKQTPVSGARQAMVGMAIAQTGKVKASLKTDKDDKGRNARVGWRQLKMYFEGAGATKLLNDPDGALVTGTSPIPAWCGIFATSATR